VNSVRRLTLFLWVNFRKLSSTVHTHTKQVVATEEIVIHCDRVEFIEGSRCLCSIMTQMMLCEEGLTMAS